MINKELIKKEYLEVLDLTENELEFYLTLVKLGKCSVQKAAREMNIFRSSAYVLVESLAKKGLISQEFKKKGRDLVPEPPKVLSRLIREKQKKVEKIKVEVEEKIPELLSSYEKSLKDPVIKVYEGVEGLKAIHQDILDTGKTLYCYPRLDIATGVLSLDFQLKFVEERIKKGIHVKGILNDSQIVKDFLKQSRSNAKGKDELREARLLPDYLKEKITAEKMFYGGKMVYMTYDKKITGVLIEHDEIVELEKKHFDILWRVSTPFKL